MDKNMPAIPHKAPPSKTTTIEKKAFIFTLEETRKGTKKLLSINCINVYAPITAS